MYATYVCIIYVLYVLLLYVCIICMYVIIICMLCSLLFLLSISSDYLYILELSVGYESNLQANVIRKRERYKDLITEQKKHKFVKFVNLSISSLGVFSKECDAFLDMLNDLRFDDRHRKYCIGKIMSIAIRSTYIFCCRNKDWSTPELLAI